LVHSSSLYFSHAFRHGDLVVILLKSDTRPIGRNIVWSSSPLCFSSYSNSPPYLCFPFVDRWYTYSKPCIRCGSCFLQLEQEFLALRLSMQPSKCVAWSSQGLDHFISLPYSWLGFLYFGCINGIQIIHWFICGWISSWRSWDDNVYRSSSDFCDVFIVLCPTL